MVSVGLKFKSQNWLYTLGILLFLVGCNDKPQEQNEKNESSLTRGATSTPKIEITINDNAHEIKVQEKEVDANQSNSYYYDYNIKSAYDVNAEPANHDASVRVKPRTTIDANINVRSPYENVQVSMIVNQLSKTFILKCSACHNDYANGVVGPSLLGRDAEYIFNKIAQFKSGEKVNVLMRDLIKVMSDEEIRELANEIYTFNLAIKNMKESYEK